MFSCLRLLGYVAHGLIAFLMPNDIALPHASNRHQYRPRRRHVPRMELVRQAVQSYRVRAEALSKPDLQTALSNTSGIWQGGDGLKHQHRLRKEWDRRS